MTFKPITLCLLFIFGSSLYNAFDLAPQWSWSSFGKGVAMGLPLVYCYFYSRPMRLVLSLIGVALMLLAISGFADDMERDRVLFIGLSIGALLGWLPAIHFLPKTVAPLVLRFFEMEGYPILHRYVKTKYLSDLTD